MKTEKHDILHTNQPIKTNAKMTQIFKSPQIFKTLLLLLQKKKPLQKAFKNYVENIHIMNIRGNNRQKKKRLFKKEPNRFYRDEH